MGPANKNTTIHTNSRYYRAIDGNEKIQNGILNVGCSNRCDVGKVRFQHKKTCFHSTSPLFSLDYSGKLIYCTNIDRTWCTGLLNLV